MVTVQTAGTFAHYQGGGLFRAIDGSGWLFAELPAQPPVRDAGSTDDLMKAARPILTIMDGLAGLVPSVTIGGRRFAKNFYRRMKILAIATPEPFLPSPTLDPANRVRLAQENPHASEHDRFTVVGVKLFAASGGRGFWSKAADFIDSMAVDNDPASTPDSVFDADREVIQQIFDDAGCAPIGRHQADRMLAWWVTDRSPEVVRVMTEPEHMHVFPSNEACATAEEFKRLHIPCDEWADHIDGSYTMTMATLGATRFMGTPETDPSARWAAQLLASRRGGGTGVIALSVDGLVEPGEVSREQVDRDKEDVIEKTMKQMQDSHKANLKVAQELTQADQEYQNRERAWPTLIEGRVHMAVGHRVLNAKNLGFPGEVKLNPDRQDSVFQDMMIGSTVQYNPSPVFWPAPILAFAGLSGRSVAGEDMGRGDKSDIPGALVGFSEADRIPVYSSPFAAAAFHTAPGFLILGRTGSGKTRTALHIASQWALLHSPDELAKDPKHPERIPCIPGVFLDPKPKSSDFGPFVEHMHGTQIMLDSPDAEGILDPLRVFPDDMASDAMDTAVEMLGQVTGGQFEDRSRQLALYSIIGYGRRYGADCTGEAVYRAWRARHEGASDANDVDPLVDDIFPQLSRLAKNNRLFRLVYATRHGGRRLAIGSGLTLLSAGTANIIADKTDAAPSDIQRWVVRMAALGSAAAVAGRDGYLVIDEAWSLLGDQFGVQVCNRMGRIARDQHYMFLLASQKVDEFNNAGLQDFIGRGILHGFGSKNEMSGRGSQVDAALELFNQTDNARLRSRLAEDPFTNPETHAPNWASLYPCRDPKSGRLLRGSIGYYVGLDGSAIPVEININNSLL